MNAHASFCDRLCAALLLAAMAAGCGGGGTGESGTPSPPAESHSQIPDSGLILLDQRPAAVVLLGQADFSSVASEDLSFLQGNAAMTEDGQLIVAANGQLKVFDSISENSAAAHRTIPLLGATNASVRGRKLAVTVGHRVLIYNDAANVGGVPDVESSSVGGCGRDTLRVPQAAFITPANQLIVGDWGNNRVLIWDQVPEAGTLPEPTVVLGQRTRDVCEPNDFNGDREQDATATEFTLNRPGSVWSDGDKLLVVDEENHRVLIWEHMPTQDFQPATYVIGQSNFRDTAPNMGGEPSEFTLSFPMSVDVSEDGRMAVADAANHRVLLWNAVPSANTVGADLVLGQSSFTRRVANDADQVGGPDEPSARTLRLPIGVRFRAEKLVVVDRGNNRVLIFPDAN